MTNYRLDFKKLRKQLDFGKVLQSYGVELKLRGDQHHGFCPLPSHKGKRNSPSFSANVKRKIWQCFGCGRKGNVLDFAVLMDGGNPKNGEHVMLTATKLSGASFSEWSEPKTTDDKDEDAVINAPLDFELKGLDATHPYLFSRCFRDETIERFGLGFCTRGLLADRVVIPLHDAKGTLVGYAGRVVNDEAISEENPKYKFPGRRKRNGVIHEFRKSLLLYNEHHIERKVSDLVIVEGFASVWWLTQAGVKNVVSLMGSSCSSEQADAIAWHVYNEGRVWIYTDMDPAGDRAADEIFLRVGSRRFVRRVRMEQGQQPTSIGPEMLKALFRVDVAI